MVIVLSIKRRGQGIYIWPDGDKYVGEFKDDKYDGKGVLFRVDGEILSGTWSAGRLIDKRNIAKVHSYLKNKYSQFKGFDYETPITNISLQNNDIIELLPPENSVYIAVVVFTGNNVSVADCNALTDRLRTELFNTKYFKVIEREMMEEILEEQGFQQTGCITDECMVEVGRLIGVEKIIGGSISKVGNVYSVSSRIVNVETGEIENIGVYDHTGNIGQLLTEGMRKVVVDLVR